MMQSNQDLSSTPLSERPSQASLPLQKNGCDLATYLTQHPWQRTGAIAGTAITLAASSTFHLNGYAQSQSIPSERTSDAAETDVLLRNNAFIESLQPQISPASSNHLQFSQTAASSNSQVIADSVEHSESGATSFLDCDTLTCLEIEAVDDKLPELNQQVLNLQVQIQDFESQYTPDSFEPHQAILTHRSVGIASQKSELGQQLTKAESQLLELQRILATQPYDETFIGNLLQDARYQDRLEYLRKVDREIAVEYSQLELDESKLESLYSQYNEISEHLYIDAQDVLDRYLAVVQSQVSESLWQEPMYQVLLQRWVDTSHEYQLLSQRQETFNYMESLLQERSDNIRQLRQDYVSLQRQLERSEQVLQSYVVKRDALERELTSAPVQPQGIATAQQASMTPTQIWSFFSRLSQKRQNELAIAILMGAGILTALSRHRRQDGMTKDYQLMFPNTLVGVTESQPSWGNANSLVSLFESYAEEGFEVFAAIGVATVLYAFNNTVTSPINLSKELALELRSSTLEPITLSRSTLDWPEHNVPQGTLYGLETDDGNAIIEIESMPWDELLTIFGPEVASLAIA